MNAVHLLHARWLLADAHTLCESGGVLVADGRVQRVLQGAGAVRRALAAEPAHVTDLGVAVLTAGLVNAHAHLDLTALADQVPGDAGFGAWIARLLEVRAVTDDRDLTAGVRKGADRLLATGTTAVGDIDTARLSPHVLCEHPLGAVVYREALDAGDPARTRAVLEEVAQPLAVELREGLSPHAPFTVSPALFEGLGALARARALPVAIHWSETEAEVQWLEDGGGPLAPLLGSSPRRTGLDLIEAAGLLGPGTALIHGNHPRPEEPPRLAAAGVTLVHCPGTHRFFGRAPAPLDAYLDAGVSLALGTDSRASNADLDLRREMAWLREAHPGLDPARVWEMATHGGARALGLDSGRLAEGAPADLAAFAVTGGDHLAILEELTAGIPDVVTVWTSSMEFEA